MVKQLVVLILCTVSLYATDYYKKGCAEGVEALNRMKEAIIAGTLTQEAVTPKGNSLMALSVLLENEPVTSDAHKEALADYKSYFAGFYETFAQQSWDDILQNQSIDPELKSVAIDMYQMTCQMCQIAKDTDTFVNAQKKQFELMKAHMLAQINQSTLELPKRTFIARSTENHFFKQGQEFGKSLALNLIRELAANKVLEELNGEILEHVMGYFKECALSDPSTQEHKKAFQNLKYYFAGIIDQFEKLTPESIKQAAEKYQVSPRVLSHTQISYEYFQSLADIVLGSSEFSQILELSEKLEGHFTRKMLEFELANAEF